jgi:hypothetical protein
MSSSLDPSLVRGSPPTSDNDNPLHPLSAVVCSVCPHAYKPPPPSVPCSAQVFGRIVTEIRPLSLFPSGSPFPRAPPLPWPGPEKRVKRTLAISRGTVPRTWYIYACLVSILFLFPFSRYRHHVLSCGEPLCAQLPFLSASLETAAGFTCHSFDSNHPLPLVRCYRACFHSLTESRFHSSDVYHSLRPSNLSAS